MRKDLFANAYRGFVLRVHDLEMTQCHWPVDGRAHCDAATQRSATRGHQGRTTAVCQGWAGPRRRQASYQAAEAHDAQRVPWRPMLLLCPTRGCSPPPGGPLARAQAGAGQRPPLGGPGSPTSQLPLGISDAAGEAHSPPRLGATYREGARSPCSVKLGGRSPRVQGAADGCSARGRHVGGNEKSPCEEITEPCTRSCSEER